jgi:hypothetical protein
MSNNNNNNNNSNDQAEEMNMHEIKLAKILLDKPAPLVSA